MFKRKYLPLTLLLPMMLAALFVMGTINLVLPAIVRAFK